MKWRRRLLFLFPFALAAQQRSGPVNYPSCPMGHRNSGAKLPAYFTNLGADGSITESLDVNFCRVCGCMFIASGTLPAGAGEAPFVGTLVNGECRTAGSGFHLVGGNAVSNEPIGNCILPKGK